MNPNVQDLIAKALSGAISLPDFYSAMSQMGLRQGEAETLLSNAQPQAQGIDPSLGQYAAGPVSGAQDMVPPMTATAPVQQQREMSILDKMRVSPAARAISAARERIMPNTGGGMAGGLMGSAQAAPAPEASPQRMQVPRDVPAPMPVADQMDYGSREGMRPGPGMNTISAAQQAINAARQTPVRPQQQQAPMQAPVPQRRVDVLGDSGGEQQQGPSALSRFIRGDFSEGADQRVMQAMQRQREESGVEPGKAEGGAATGKATSGKDAALHKALEIIHMMLSRR